MKVFRSSVERFILVYERTMLAVVWLSRKDTFEKVVREWAIRDRRTFSGEILGENEKAENEKIDDKGEAVKQFERIEFTEFCT